MGETYITEYRIQNYHRKTRI